MDGEHLTQHIGQVLRHLRKQRGWSLEHMGDVTGVSKPMLSQLERGETNPSVVTLWKISSGLEIPFASFLQGLEEPEVILMRRGQHPRLADNGGSYVVHNLFSTSPPQAVDLFLASVQGGYSHTADAHGMTVKEGVWVVQGDLVLSLGTRTYELGAGDSLQFMADVPHTYTNSGQSPCEFIVILAYGAADRPHLQEREMP